MGSNPAFLSNSTTNAVFHSWGNSPVAIERLIMCVRSGSNSGIYCLTNLVKSTAGCFWFHDQLAHIIFGDHFMSYTGSWRIQSTLQVAWQTHSLWPLTWPMRSPFETPVDYPIFISSRNRLLGSTADMSILVTVVEMRALSSAHWQPFRFFACN